jgi:hypothetical protein
MDVVFTKKVMMTIEQTCLVVAWLVVKKVVGTYQSSIHDIQSVCKNENLVQMIASIRGARVCDRCLYRTKREGPSTVLS